MIEIACFISPHGFGHATRAIAVLEALRRLHPDCHAHLFTTVPETLFAASLIDFTYHPATVDIGLVQSSALTLDIPATCRQLDALLPYSRRHLTELASQCSDCSLILCDIAPIGIAVGQLAGIASVLIENFTWDWIYTPYTPQFPELSPHIHCLDALFRQADYRIQTEPLCRAASRDLLCGPIFRRTRSTRESIRARLSVGERQLVLVTMGGIAQSLPDLRRLEDESDLFFVMPGQKNTRQVSVNCLLLQRDSELYHPDLIGAADLVVCKAGYSTLAECCQAGIRVITVGREDFAESAPLQRYVEKALGGLSITPAMYENGTWIPLGRTVLSRPRPTPAEDNGADEAAKFLSSLL